MTVGQDDSINQEQSGTWCVDLSAELALLPHGARSFFVLDKHSRVIRAYSIVLPSDPKAILDCVEKLSQSDGPPRAIEMGRGPEWAPLMRWAATKRIHVVHVSPRGLGPEFAAS